MSEGMQQKQDKAKQNTIHFSLGYALPCDYGCLNNKGKGD